MKAVTLAWAGAFVLFSAFIIQDKKLPQQSLYNIKWTLKKIYDSSGATEVNSKAFIKFNESKLSAGGNGSCNNFGSNFKREGKMIRFSDIFSTKMYCEGVQPTEDAFLRQLANVTRFKIKEKKLILYGDKEVLLEFVAE